MTKILIEHEKTDIDFKISKLFTPVAEKGCEKTKRRTRDLAVETDVKMLGRNSQDLLSITGHSPSRW